MIVTHCHRPASLPSLSFHIEEGGQFCFQGESQPMENPCGGDERSFRIHWTWGSPTFTLQPDGITLLENGETAFTLLEPPQIPLGEYEKVGSSGSLRFMLDEDDEGRLLFVFEGTSQRVSTITLTDQSAQRSLSASA